MRNAGHRAARLDVERELDNRRLVGTGLLRIELELGGGLVGLLDLPVYAAHLDLAEGLDERAALDAFCLAGGRAFLLGDGADAVANFSAVRSRLGGRVQGQQKRGADNGGKDGLFHITTRSTDNTDKSVLQKNNARSVPQ